VQNNCYRTSCHRLQRAIVVVQELLFIVFLLVMLVTVLRLKERMH
jgi:hypothetical protein